MVKYVCEICGKVSTQKSHHEAHLETESHKNKVDNFILKLEQRTTGQILEEYPQYSRNSVGFYDEDFLIDGEQEEDNITAVEIMTKTCKQELIKRIINNKINQRENNEYLMDDSGSFNKLKEANISLRKTNKKLMKRLEDMEIMLYQTNNSSLDVTDELLKNSISGGPSNHHYISLLIHKKYKGLYAYCDNWFYYNDSFWVQSTKTCDHLINKIQTEIYQLYTNYINSLKDDNEIYNCKNFIDRLMYDNRYINSLMRSLRVTFNDEDIINKFDSNVYLLGLNNGTIDLNEKKFRKSLPTDYITMSMGYSLNVRQPIHFDEIEFELMKSLPHYNELNNDLINFISHRIPNEKIRNYFMQRTSQTLLGVDKHEIMSIWSANETSENETSDIHGCSSKKDIFKLLSNTLGDYFGYLPGTVITKKTSRLTNCLGCTKGKRLVVINDHNKETISSGLLKELMGGDKIISKQLHKKCVEFTPQFNVILDSNGLPNLQSNDEGTLRRLELIYFDNIQGTSNIVDEAWTQIFLGILLKYYLKEEYPVPQDIKNNIEVFEDNSEFRKWLNECCCESENILIDGFMKAPSTLNDLYDICVEWLYENGYSETINTTSKVVFKKILLRWQEKSKYGLSQGTKDNCFNGTGMKPRFNLIENSDK